MSDNPLTDIGTGPLTASVVSYSLSEDEPILSSVELSNFSPLGSGNRFLVLSADALVEGQKKKVVVKALNRSKHDETLILEMFTLAVMAESFAHFWPKSASPLRALRTQLVRLPTGMALLQEFVASYDTLAPVDVIHSFLHFAHELCHRRIAFEGILSLDTATAPPTYVVRDLRAHTTTDVFGMHNCGLDGLLAFLADHPTGAAASARLGLPPIEAGAGHPMVDDAEYVSDFAIKLGGPPPMAQWKSSRFESVRSRVAGAIRRAPVSAIASPAASPAAAAHRDAAKQAAAALLGALARVPAPAAAAPAPAAPATSALGDDPAVHALPPFADGDSGTGIEQGNPEFSRGCRGVIALPSGICGIPPQGVYPPIVSRLTFSESSVAFVDALRGLTTIALVGTQAALLTVAHAVDAALALPANTLRSAIERVGTGSTELWAPSTRVIIGVLPARLSRIISQTRAWIAAGILRAVNTAIAVDKNMPTGIFHIYDNAAHLPALAAATARAFPTVYLQKRYTHRSDPVDPSQRGNVRVFFVDSEAPSRTVPLTESSRRVLAGIAGGVTWTVAVTDLPASHLHVPQFVDRVRAIVSDLARCPAIVEHGGTVSIGVLRGAALRKGGYGGLIAVGSGSAEPPALITLQFIPRGYTPTADRDAPAAAGAVPHFVWVGKGIIFDTGGLTLKTREGMCTMKSDMAGAAAVVGAFHAAVSSGSAAGAGNGDTRTGQYAITAVLCMTENAIGPDSYRPDDIVTFRSGFTCEINNTDAEGRVVLADGVAHGVDVLREQNDSPTLLIDIATLTGAQPAATGASVAALVSNDEESEQLVLAAARMSGEDAYPLPYMPEQHDKNLYSNIADCVNSALDRSDAQCSVAGHFIAKCGLPASGVRPESPRWVHIDMAGPSRTAGRATGYGVGILLAAANVKAAAGASWPRP